ncbi:MULTISPECIES: phosphodiester glycosidase family protein [unclassified Anabaena]|uniref:phosphodiester glycosidase family protein n=1 Tax=unclassified Anabaena TaxID=2619674 RepID=UPI0039C7026B
MKKFGLLGLMLISWGIWFGLRSSTPTVSSVVANTTPLPQKNIRYEQRTLPESIVHVLWIPSNSRFLVTPALSTTLKTIEEFADNHQAIAILNAGFFDPANQKSTSYVVLAGEIAADPKQNERLVNNPNLKPYLSQIFNRSEFRRYECGQTIRYDIALHNDAAPVGCKLMDAMGAGPSLLPELTSVQEGFVDRTQGRDALGSQQLNARTAIGITNAGSIVLVMVAQKPATPASGMSLPGLADFMKTLGAQRAMNLDGGSSSSLYYNGKTVYGRMNAEGNPVKRPVKSVLLIQEK